MKFKTLLGKGAVSSGEEEDIDEEGIEAALREIEAGKFDLDTFIAGLNSFFF